MFTLAHQYGRGVVEEMLNRHHIGFVGAGENKFTELGKCKAIGLIQSIIEDVKRRSTNLVVVSGRSPMGGIDIWAEECAKAYGLETDIKAPKVHQWNPPDGYGYKARNIDIAKTSDELYVIVVDEYPKEYKGQRFDVCYHCAKHPEHPNSLHKKSGACYTGFEALKRGKRVDWIIVKNY